MELELIEGTFEHMLKLVLDFHNILNKMVKLYKKERERNFILHFSSRIPIYQLSPSYSVIISYKTSILLFK